MKKYVGFCLVMSISTIVVCSERPRKALEGSQEIAKSALEGHKSGSLRESTEALTIAVTKATTEAIKSKNLERFSSGSSPAGADHLCPGQVGNGLLLQMAPIYLGDPNCHWYK